MDACKMRVVRENVEYQCITEDSKTRVYLSIVPTKDEETLRKELNARKRQRTKKKIVRFIRNEAIPVLKIAGIEFLKFVFAVLAGVLVYLKLAERLRIIRGYDAIGGELIFAVIISIVAYYVADFLLKRRE